MPKATPADRSRLSVDRETALRLIPVSRETLDRLDRYVDLLLDWQPRVNLVAASTLHQLWTRHIADSLQLVALAPAAKTWIDLGSGAGFPGLVIACALARLEGAAVHLVESDSRKAAFLREAIRVTGSPAHVQAERIEAFSGRWQGIADVVTARALAPLPKLLTYAAPLLERGAQGLFPKGQHVEAELTEAAKSWHMEIELVESLTSTGSRILRVRAVRTIPR